MNLSVRVNHQVISEYNGIVTVAVFVNGKLNAIMSRNAKGGE